MEQSFAKAKDVLPSDLCRAVDAVDVTAAYDAMSDISVALTSGEPNTNCGMDAIAILSRDPACPCRESVPVNSQRPGSAAMPIP